MRDRYDCHFGDSIKLGNNYSNPKSFVNFLLPDLSKGRVGVG